MMIRNTPGSRETNRHSNAISDVICDLPNSLQNKSRLLVQGPKPFQVAWLSIAAPMGCMRTTAFSNGQKLRTPAWFRATGTAVA